MKSLAERRKEIESEIAQRRRLLEKRINDAVEEFEVETGEPINDLQLDAHGKVIINFERT